MNNTHRVELINTFLFRNHRLLRNYMLRIISLHAISSLLYLSKDLNCKFYISVFFEFSFSFLFSLQSSVHNLTSCALYLRPFYNSTACSQNVCNYIHVKAFLSFNGQLYLFILSFLRYISLLYALFSLFLFN